MKRKIEIIERRNKNVDAAWEQLETAIGNAYDSFVFEQLRKAIQNVESFCVPTPKILAFVYKIYADLAEETP